MPNFLEEEGLSYYDNKLKNYIPSVVEDNLAKGIFGNETVLSTDTVPFASKIMNTGKYQRKKFVGCSYVWNQMIENGDFSDGTTGWSIYNAVYGSISASNNVITLTANQAKPYNDVAFRKYNLNRKANHKYYISFSFKTTSSNGIAFSGTMLPQGTGFDPTTEWTKITLLTSGDTDDDNAYITFGFGDPAVGDTLDVKEVYMVDLTQLFGSTAIADYIYNLEQATAGAGIAKLKELGFFTENYYAYDAGSIQSVDIKEYAVTGFNLWDEDWKYYGNNYAVGAKNHISVFPNTVYYFKSSKYALFEYYDADKNSISTESISANATFTTPDMCKYIKFKTASTYGTTYKNDICINLSDPARNGQYEPYHKTTYPLTPTELRGVPKLDANNNIYADGDEYASDGDVTRKYDIVDLGTLNWSGTTSTFYTSSNSIGLKRPNDSNGKTAFKGICSKYRIASYVEGVGNNGDKSIYTTWASSSSSYLYIRDSSYSNAEDFKAAMSGVYLVYEKATPTTETLTPFDYPQSVGSLEEIVDYKVEQEERDVAIPTGHVTEYMGKGGEFTLPTLPETPSVLAYDGHNAYWEENTINLVKAFMNENRRTRRDITNDLSNLSQAVSEQNLGKYGYSIGDYFTGTSGYTYVLADYNTFKGTYTPNCINTDHLGVLVLTNTTSKWYDNGDASEVGYAGSTLHSYLTTTVLDTIKTDFIALFGGTTGLEHLKSHTKRLTTGLESLEYFSSQYICAPSEIQVYGSVVWGANGYQTGEACKKLEVFDKFKHTEIIKQEYPWLRDMMRADGSCFAARQGEANYLGNNQLRSVWGLIVFV